MSPSSENHNQTIINQYKNSLSLGLLLKKRREELELSLDKVARDTKIRRQYLDYLESGSYDRLRDDIYTRGYVKNYADYLGLETAPILLLYRKERDARREGLKLRGGDKNQKIGLTPIDSPRWIITPRSFVILCISGFLGLILAYLVWQFVGLAAAPKISLDNSSEETVNTTVAYVGGHVNEGAEVSINGSPILTNGSGAFREQVALVAGANEIKITAKNKLGKSAGVTKTFIAKLPSTATVSNTTAQNQKFDGVQLVVHVNSNTSWIIVSADDVETFRGTMLPGSTQTFQAADRLKISVGNAGAVDVILTNQQVAGKDLGTLGQPNEIKRDLEFKKDTNTL